MDEQIQYETDLLERLFGYKGQITTGGQSDICYDVHDQMTRMRIDFANGKAELHEAYARGCYEHIDTKELSEEDVVKLEAYGYTVR